MVAEDRGSGVSTSAGTHMKGYVCVCGGGVLLTWMHLDRDVDVKSVSGREQGGIIPRWENVNNSASLRPDWVANTVN